MDDVRRVSPCSLDERLSDHGIVGIEVVGAWICLRKLGRESQEVDENRKQPETRKSRNIRYLCSMSDPLTSPCCRGCKARRGMIARGSINLRNPSGVRSTMEELDETSKKMAL
jgi:hypothetical protein